MTSRTHTPPPHIVASDRCAACGRRLTGTYYLLVGRTERYCPTCIKTRPRCDNCGAPLGAGAMHLHDGRLQCARCHKTAVYDPAFARKLYAETVAAVAQQSGLVVRGPVEFRLVDAPTLHGIRAEHDGSVSPDDRTLGLYHRRGEVRVIYLLYGLPRLLFRITVAHEYAHAWQSENCPHGLSFELREGFAEWVAYRHLQYIGSTRAAERMLNANHPYRESLEHVLTLEQRLGTAGLIASMQQGA